MEFNFKEFKVIQKDSAAKITTDATVFAAAVPLISSVKRVLEIGAGTGVISLMISQRKSVEIQAVEIDRLAFEEAKRNFENSPFSDRLNITHGAIQNFAEQHKYDLIVSNPPFFTDNLKSEMNIRKNTAYHTDKLSFEELASAISQHLDESGIAYIMLPEYESLQLDKVMEKIQFLPQHILYIKHNESKLPLRRIVGYKRIKKSHPIVEYIIIRTLNGHFTDQYRQLMTPYLTIF